MIKHIFFAFAVFAQFAIIAAGPAEKIVVRETGKVIRIRTAPVDPYCPMRGYYATLNFEISTPPDYIFERHEDHAGKLIHTILEKGDDGVWHAVGWKHRFPEDVAENQIIIRGRETGREAQPIRYGIEQYFLPEQHREQIEARAAQAWRAQRAGSTDAGQPVLADVAVDKQGRASILRLIIDDEVYEY